MEKSRQSDIIKFLTKRKDSNPSILEKLIRKENYTKTDNISDSIVKPAVSEDIKGIMDIYFERIEWMKEKNIPYSISSKNTRNYYREQIKNGNVYVCKQNNQVIGSVVIESQDTEKTWINYKEEPENGCVYAHDGMTSPSVSGKDTFKKILDYISLTTSKPIRFDVYPLNPKLENYYKSIGVKEIGIYKDNEGNRRKLFQKDWSITESFIKKTSKKNSEDLIKKADDSINTFILSKENFIQKINEEIKNFYADEKTKENDLEYDIALHYNEKYIERGFLKGEELWDVITQLYGKEPDENMPYVDCNFYWNDNVNMVADYDDFGVIIEKGYVWTYTDPMPIKILDESFTRKTTKKDSSDLISKSDSLIMDEYAPTKENFMRQMKNQIKLFHEDNASYGFTTTIPDCFIKLEIDGEEGTEEYSIYNIERIWNRISNIDFKEIDVDVNFYFFDRTYGRESALQDKFGIKIFRNYMWENTEPSPWKKMVKESFTRKTAKTNNQDLISRSDKAIHSYILCKENFFNKLISETEKYHNSDYYKKYKEPLDYRLNVNGNSTEYIFGTDEEEINDLWNILVNEYDVFDLWDDSEIDIEGYSNDVEGNIAEPADVGLFIFGKDLVSYSEYKEYRNRNSVRESFTKKTSRTSTQNLSDKANLKISKETIHDFFIEHLDSRCCDNYSEYIGDDCVKKDTNYIWWITRSEENDDYFKKLESLLDTNINESIDVFIYPYKGNKDVDFEIDGNGTWYQPSNEDEFYLIIFKLMQMELKNSLKLSESFTKRTASKSNSEIVKKADETALGMKWEDFENFLRSKLQEKGIHEETVNNFPLGIFFKIMTLGKRNEIHIVFNEKFLNAKLKIVNHNSLFKTYGNNIGAVDFSLSFSIADRRTREFTYRIITYKKNNETMMVRDTDFDTDIYTQKFYTHRYPIPRQDENVPVKCIELSERLVSYFISNISKLNNHVESMINSSKDFSEIDGHNIETDKVIKEIIHGDNGFDKFMDDFNDDSIYESFTKKTSGKSIDDIKNVSDSVFDTESTIKDIIRKKNVKGSHYFQFYFDKSIKILGKTYNQVILPFIEDEFLKLKKDNLYLETSRGFRLPFDFLSEKQKMKIMEIMENNESFTKKTSKKSIKDLKDESDIELLAVNGIKNIIINNGRNLSDGHNRVKLLFTYVLQKLRKYSEDTKLSEYNRNGSVDLEKSCWFRKEELITSTDIKNSISQYIGGTKKFKNLVEKNDCIFVLNSANIGRKSGNVIFGFDILSKNSLTDGNYSDTFNPQNFILSEPLLERNCVYKIYKFLLNLFPNNESFTKKTSRKTSSETLDNAGILDYTELISNLVESNPSEKVALSVNKNAYILNVSDVTDGALRKFDKSNSFHFLASNYGLENEFTDSWHLNKSYKDDIILDRIILLKDFTDNKSDLRFDFVYTKEIDGINKTQCGDKIWIENSLSKNSYKKKEKLFKDIFQYIKTKFSNL